MTFKKIVLFPLRIFFDKVFDPFYKKRLAKAIASLCEDNSYILDFGCDDGSTADMIMKINPSLKIVGIDIQSNRISKIPRKIYNGNKIPYPDNTFDIVMSLNVLHHTKDILRHVKEMKRVSKKYLLIKDNMVFGPFSKSLICFTDYISNVPYGIKCVFNFLSSEQWNKIFKSVNLKMIEKPRDFNYGFGINERLNPTFKLKKI